MEIRILDKEEQQRIYPEAYEMLAAADNEFVPPLSSRSSSTQQDFSQSATNDSIIQYFDQLKTQRFAAVFEDGALIAFVSYKENYSCREIAPEELPNIYLSTLIVSPKARGKGVTTALYKKLFSEYENVNIFTRTWSTNTAHIKILDKYGFEVIKVLENDRGNGIDTIYFKKSHK
ncbi:MAG: GNAT family N-acetyltransferase [Oscillospiraceae bacterium]|nr:GNAT family N-acetyltransferase [Oscillospiraceae bacterium]